MRKTRLHAAIAAAACLAAVAASAAEPDKPQINGPKTFWGGETAEAAMLQAQYAPKRGTMGVADHAMVAACHDRSVEIGLDILRRGGTAADAFIAVTFADWVQSPGASSLGGPMGALVYDARTGKAIYLGAPLKTVASPTGQWTPTETALGKQVLVPGAVAGLEALHARAGRLPWAELVRPAAKLAREGFPVTGQFSAITTAFAAALKASDYGRTAYLHPDGSAYKPGETLKLPVLADTLDAIAEHGAAWIYTGPWAKEAVAAVHARGGEMTEADLAGYRPEWSVPLAISYRGDVLYAPSGHDSGGARLLLALKALEHGDIKKLGHYSQSLDGLEAMVRVTRAVAAEPSLYSQAFYDGPGPQALLDGPRPGEIWSEASARMAHAPAPQPGSHSYAVVVVDAAGDVVAGTHTIESLPFGTNGIFAGGVPLNNTGILHPDIPGSPYTTPPGQPIIEPLSAVIGFRHGKLELAMSTFSASLWPGDFEAASSLLDFDWTPEETALTPRFGANAIDLVKLTADPSQTMLDKRYSADVVAAMKARGVNLTQAGYVDTGMLVMIKRDARGRLTGFTPEQLGEGRAAGY
jgi:gamma-glutamyltranspeptidase/glutathione hydrolase